MIFLYNETMPSHSLRPTTHVLFEAAFLVFAALWIVGAFIDGWAHIHLAGTLETFFTPWHAAFYSGMTLTGLLLFGALIYNRRLGYTWKHALPREYMFALGGVVIAALGGVGDLVWHLLFGIESGAEALISPTHLMLAFGGTVAVGGPLHAIWYRDTNRERIHTWVITFSFMLVFMTVNFMLQFLHPFAFPWLSKSFLFSTPISGDYTIALGIANTIVYSGLFTGFILATLRYFTFPVGSFTVILGIDALAMTLMQTGFFYFVFTAAVSGILIDLFYRHLAGPTVKTKHVRTFASLAPASIAFSYVGTLLLRGDMGWSIHLWFGLIVIAGLTGYLLSYLLLPPGDILKRVRY